MKLDLYAYLPSEKQYRLWAVMDGKNDKTRKEFGEVNFFPRTRFKKRKVYRIPFFVFFGHTLMHFFLIIRPFRVITGE